MTKSLSLAVIGCGVIGSRHAQALGLLDRSATIYLVDPSDDARAQAVRYCREGMQPDQTKKLIDLYEIDALPEEIDIAIVATGAAERSAILMSLLQSRRVAHFILEKFLFQRESDYSAVAGRLDAVQARAWVNCPRRLWPGYQSLRGMMDAQNSSVTLSCAAHPKVGMGTSAIHLLDTLAYLSGRSDFELKGDRLSDELLPNKRGGVELAGQLYGFSPRDDFFRFSVHDKGSLPLVITVETAVCRAIIDEASKMMRISRMRDDWRWIEIPFGTLLQSEMTHRVVAQLVDTGACGLPSLEESSRLHLAILRPLLAHYRRVADSNATACPIT